MCHALQGPVVMGAFQEREAEKYGSIHQELGQSRIGTAKREREKERAGWWWGAGGVSLPRTFKRAVRRG